MAEYLIHFNQQWVGDHPEEWYLTRVEPSMAVVAEMSAEGILIFAGGLEEDIATAASADATSGEIVVTDGPYAETKEQLGGYYEFECQNLDEAITWAAKIPGAATGSIEVRPIFQM